MDSRLLQRQAELARAWQHHTDEQLIALAQDGNASAAGELDRRGVEPPVAESGPPPVHSLDLTQEIRPNTAYLREWASAMKLEADVLQSHAGDYVEALKNVPIGENADLAIVRVSEIRCVDALLRITSDRLIALVDALEADDAPTLRVADGGAA